MRAVLYPGRVLCVPKKLVAQPMRGEVALQTGWSQEHPATPPAVLTVESSKSSELIVVMLELLTARRSHCAFQIIHRGHELIHLGQSSSLGRAFTAVFNCAPIWQAATATFSRPSPSETA